MLKKLWVCSALSVALVGAGTKQVAAQLNADESQYTCRVVHLPTSWAFHPAPGAIKTSNASFSGAGEATFDLTFHNSAKTAIKSLTLGVEYMADEDDVIDRVAMSAHVEPSNENIPSYVFKPARQWQVSLPPGGTATMASVDYGIRTARCPSRARITFAQVEFSDNSVRRYSSPGWRVDPRPVIIPILRDAIPELPVEPPVSLLANLKISTSGGVADVVPEELTDAVLVDWLRERMKQSWKFYPGLIDGKPVDSELNVLFLIHAKGMPQFSGNEPTSRSVTVIRFIWTRDRYPGADVLETMAVMYGLLDEGAVPDFAIPGIRTLPPSPYWDGVADDNDPDDL